MDPDTPKQETKAGDASVSEHFARFLPIQAGNEASVFVSLVFCLEAV
jgi:hypothetical protein